MFRYEFQSTGDRIRWYARQLLPLRYSWDGELQGLDGKWYKASCRWRMWLGVYFGVKWWIE